MPFVLTLHDDSFIRGYYYQDTIHAMEDPEKEANLASYPCSAFCMKLSTCGGFTVQSNIACTYLEESDIPRLVKSSKDGRKSREVWVKESLLGSLVPHLLVISGSGKLQDISFDTESSPPIDYGIEVPISSPKPGPYVVNHDLSMLMHKPGAAEFLSWKFDDQTPAKISLDSFNSMQRGYFATQNGRLFFMKAGKAYTIVNNRLIPLKDFEATYQGCAAFEPGNEDTVYIIGGVEDGYYKKFLYKYQFSTNEYTNLEKDIPVNGGIRRHSCVGVETSSGDKMIVVIGGETGIYSEQSDGKTDSVRTFNIGTNQWGLWPSYPLASYMHRAIFANGYIYAAGGEDSEGGYIKKIFKMEASAEGSWEEFADLDEESEYPYLIYYNV